MRLETEVTYANLASVESEEFCESAEGPLAMSEGTVVENWVPPLVGDRCCQCEQHNTLNEAWSVDDGDSDKNNNICVANCSSTVSVATIKSTIASEESCNSPHSDESTSSSGSSDGSAEECSSDETAAYRDQNTADVAGVDSETDCQSSGRSSETDSTDSSKSTTSDSQSDSSIDEILEEAMGKCSTEHEDNRYPLDGQTMNAPRPLLTAEATGPEPRGSVRTLSCKR